MIFVTIGTQDKPFYRLIRAVENAVISGKIKEQVIVQAGNTKYKSDYIKVLDYIPYEEFNKYLLDSDVIITHGGVGSILNAVKIGKKVIAIPRLQKYGEHINDHQLQIVQKMTEAGYILSTKDENNIVSKLKEIENFVPKVYTSNTENFVESFNKILEEVINE